MTAEKKSLPKPKPIIECFAGLPDPRMDRTRRHNFIDILMIGLCSALVGGESFSDMERFGWLREDWLKGFLELPGGIPSHDTFNRVFSALDPHAFLECFGQWVQGICPNLSDEVVAIDGKALRRALNQGEAIPYIVSAWACEHGLALGQVKVDEKSNEITAVPKLLNALKLKGAIVTLDAMGCQKDIASHIIQRQADYVLALKGNHATALEEVKAFFQGRRSPLRHPVRANSRRHTDGFPPDHRQGAWPHRNPPILAIHRLGLVRGQRTLEGPQEFRHGRVHPQGKREEHHRAALLLEQPAPRRTTIRPRRAWTLGRGKQFALVPRHYLSRRRQPRPNKKRRPESRLLEENYTQPPQERQDQQRFPQGQALRCCTRPRIPSTFTGNLDA